VPDTRAVLDDPRVHLHMADIRDFLATREPATADAILLDVDNGPDYLVHAHNAQLYAGDSLSHTARILRPDGVLAIWSATESSDLEARVQSVYGSCDGERLTARKGGATFDCLTPANRELDYVVYVATKTART